MEPFSLGLAGELNGCCYHFIRKVLTFQDAVGITHLVRIYLAAVKFRHTSENKLVVVSALMTFQVCAERQVNRPLYI